MRIGVIGCSYVATGQHLPALRQMKGVAVVAVCDRDKDKARETAKRFAIPSYCMDSSEMLEGRLDLVHICTPPQTHAALCLQALDAGCHVLVEKPLALSVSEADAVIEASRKSNGKLCVCHNSLFNPVVMKARSLVESGAVGRVLHVDIKYCVRSDDRMLVNGFWTHSLPGGIFGEIAPHPVYLQQALLGNIEDVSAFARKSLDFDWMKSDELLVLLKAKNATGSIFVSCNSPRYKATMDIFGTDLTLHLDLWTSVMTTGHAASFGPVSSALGNLGESFQLARDTALTVLKYSLGRLHSGHSVLIPRFIESIRGGTEPPITGEAGRETVRILEEIWRHLDKNVSI